MSIEESIAKKLRESRRLKEGRYTGTTTVRNTAESILRDHGLNNSIGKYDKFVNKMWGLYKETLLDEDKLKTVMEKEFQKMYPNLKVSESTEEEEIPTEEEELKEDATGTLVANTAKFVLQKYKHVKSMVDKLMDGSGYFAEHTLYQEISNTEKVEGNKEISVKLSKVIALLSDIEKLRNHK